MAILRNNTHLKKIRIQKSFVLNNDDIERLSLVNLNVVEISVVCHINIQGQNLVQLVKNSKQLKNLHLKYNILISSHYNDMRDTVWAIEDQLRNEWNVNVHMNE